MEQNVTSTTNATMCVLIYVRECKLREHWCNKSECKLQDGNMPGVLAGGWYGLKGWKYGAFV